MVLTYLHFRILEFPLTYQSVNSSAVQFPENVTHGKMFAEFKSTCLLIHGKISVKFPWLYPLVMQYKYRTWPISFNGLPIKNDDFPWQNVKLPDGKS